jgi:hypothetical protein
MKFEALEPHESDLVTYVACALRCWDYDPCLILCSCPTMTCTNSRRAHLASPFLVILHTCDTLKLQRAIPS